MYMVYTHKDNNNKNAHILCHTQYTHIPHTIHTDTHVHAPWHSDLAYSLVTFMSSWYTAIR